MKSLIRPASPPDAADVCAVHCSDISHWRAWDASGSARPARYADLTPCQRWLNGGPWLDPGLCRRHLQRVAEGGGYAWVAEHKGRALAEAEAFLADEPPPYGRNLNLSALYVHRHFRGQGLGSALLAAALAFAQEQGCHTFTVSRPDAPAFYAAHGLRPGPRWGHWQLPARRSRVRYTVDPLPDTGYSLVRGYALLAGRFQNAGHDWERVRSGGAPDFPEWRGVKLDRNWMTVRGQRAAVVLEESPRAPGTAEAFVFAPPDVALTGQWVSAIGDHAARSGFTRVNLFVPAPFAHPHAHRLEATQRVMWKVVRGQESGVSSQHSA